MDEQINEQMLQRYASELAQANHARIAAEAQNAALRKQVEALNERLEACPGDGSGCGKAVAEGSVEGE